jgi:hypothetical protein
MSDRTQPRNSVPWIVAAVLALVTAALVVALVHILSVRSSQQSSASVSYALTPDQTRAVQAGAIEAANLTTLARQTYERDFSRALGGATGALRKDLTAKKGAYLSAMNAGKFDLKSSVLQSAFESQSGDQVLVMVTLNGTHVVDQVASPITTPQRFELTMVKTGTKWLAADLLSVGVQ